MVSQPTSIMPEGFELLPEKELADLLEFLAQPVEAPKRPAAERRHSPSPPRSACPPSPASDGSFAARVIQRAGGIVTFWPSAMQLNRARAAQSRVTYLLLPGTSPSETTTCSRRSYTCTSTPARSQ